LFILPGLFPLLQAAKELPLRRTRGIAIPLIIIFQHRLARRYLLPTMIIAIMLASIPITASNEPLALRKLYMSIWLRSLSFFAFCSSSAPYGLPTDTCRKRFSLNPWERQ